VRFNVIELFLELNLVITEGKKDPSDRLKPTRLNDLKFLKRMADKKSTLVGISSIP